MTKLYLAQIPRHFAVSRGTIYRDIRHGKLSAEDNGKGRTVVDLSELERVYKRKRQGEVSHIVPRGQSDTTDSGRETSVLRREVELLREQNAEHVSVIDDLRSERDRLLRLLEEQAHSVKLLTDKRIRGNVRAGGGHGVDLSRFVTRSVGYYTATQRPSNTSNSSRLNNGRRSKNKGWCPRPFAKPGAGI